MNSIINWTQNWFSNQCDGDWEHSFGIEITTVDNPGWYIKIDIKDTELESINLDSGLNENSETDWYFFKFKDGKFEASGDITKLEFLLNKFKEYAEKNSIS